MCIEHGLSDEMAAFELITCHHNFTQDADNAINCVVVRVILSSLITAINKSSLILLVLLN